MKVSPCHVFPKKFLALRHFLPISSSFLEFDRALLMNFCTDSGSYGRSVTVPLSRSSTACNRRRIDVGTHERKLVACVPWALVYSDNLCCLDLECLDLEVLCRYHRFFRTASISSIIQPIITVGCKQP